MVLMYKRKHCTTLNKLKWDKPVVNQADSQGNQCQDIGDALTKDFQSSRKGKNHAQNIDNNLTTHAKKTDLEIFSLESLIVIVLSTPKNKFAGENINFEGEKDAAIKILSDCRIGHWYWHFNMENRARKKQVAGNPGRLSFSNRIWIQFEPPGIRISQGL